MSPYFNLSFLLVMKRNIWIMHTQRVNGEQEEYTEKSKAHL